MNLNLRVRIALISAAAVAVAIAISAMVTFAVAKRELVAEVDESLFSRVEKVDSAESAGDLLLAVQDDVRPGGFFSRGASGYDALYWRLFTADGPILASRGVSLPFGEEEEKVSIGELPHVVRTVAVEGQNLRVLTAETRFGTVQIARSLVEVDDSLAGLASVLKLAAVVGAVLAAVAGYLVARGAARPIGELAEAAEHVAETQELAARIEVDRADEVGRLAGSFNAMLAALESSREQQRRLVHDAGHELRTPLTAIRTNVELLGRIDNIPPEDREQMIADVNTEIQELSGLVAELVDLAAEPLQGEMVMEDLNLADLVDRVADKFRRRTGRTITIEADDSIVEGSTIHLERAVGNLIDNAAKWSPSGSPISVTVSAGLVSVADEGSGIDAADRPRVFDRFYRATKDRSTPGSGLGLSIVAKVAADHGGSAFVGDESKGAVVGFKIPVVGEDGWAEE